MKIFIRTLILILVFTCTFVFHTPKTYAATGVAWGTLNIVGDIWKQMAEVIYTEITNAIKASAKMMAIKQATSVIESLLYGGSSSPRNITNFNDFLITDPADNAITYGQDFLTNTLRGTGSADYTSIGGSSGGDNLTQMLQDSGQGVLDQWEGKNTPTVDYAEHCGDMSDGNYFSDGNFKCFSAIMSNPVNTPIGMALAVDEATAIKYQQEKEVAMLIATSTGTLPDIDENGNVRLPKSVVEEIQLQQITLPLEALANGDSSVFSSMIQSFAVSLIVGIVERGLGEVEESVDKNVKSFTSQYEKEYGKMMEKIGPAASYSFDSYSAGQKQQSPSPAPSSTSTWVNPDTGQPGL
jgi:hypothetical protein